ncbi:MAG: RsmB/NOP family class I SAM-dependent RNA methyltransferase [Pseudomonadota bacterium]
MTPAARISAAIDILDRIFDGLPAEQALTRWARGARYAGSKDRAAIRDHVFQALRCRRSYAALGGGHTARAIMIGALRASDTDPATLFTGEGHAPDPLTTTEASGGRAPTSQAEAVDLPDWLWAAFERDLGQDAMATAQAHQTRAPVTLRVNLRMKTVPQAIEDLYQEGIEVRRTDRCDTALIVVSGERKIRQAHAYLSGAVELQDASSQAAMARITVPPGAKVLDYCAGGGGKTLALAGRMPPGQDAQFFAHDIDPARMKDLPARAARAGVEVTCLTPADLHAEPAFDIVLVDAPCSGSGTWRRNPEAKWRLTPEGLDKFTKIQRDILQSSSVFLRPKGQLLYTTCSILTLENEAQTAAFCAAHPQFDVTHDIRWSVDDDGDGFYFAALAEND